MDEDEDPISGAVVWLLKILMVLGGAFVVASSITSSSWRNASIMATPNPGGPCTTDSPTVEPCLDGLTTTGQPKRRWTSVSEIGAMAQSAVATPADLNSRLEMSLSMAMPLAIGPLPVYGTPMISRSACRVTETASSNWVELITQRIRCCIRIFGTPPFTL